jgi:hypothetical protein
VPVEEVVELKMGQKSISERKFFPGYVLVEMEMNDESWHLVKSTPKVTGFVGGTANKPTPISEKEVAKIMQQMQEGVDKPRPKVLFEPARGRSRQGRPVHRFSWRRRAGQLRKEPPARFGDDFRPADAGRTGVWSGRESLILQLSRGAWRCSTHRSSAALGPRLSFGERSRERV